MKNLFSLSLITTLSLLTACGSSDLPTNLPTKQGAFVDAPVEGLSFTTSSGLTGTTNAAGVFNYLAGDTVTFSLGNVNFPPVAAGDLISPIDLFGASSANHPGALAIARLLQSVDSDGNPDNGIKINLTKLASTLTQPADWSNLNAVQLAAMLSDGASGLRSENQARTHLTSQLAIINKDPQMSLVGRYASGGTPSAPSLVAEIVSYHANSKSLFITVDTATEPSSFKRIDISGLGTTAVSSPITANNLQVSARFNVAADVNDNTFTAGGVQSLDVTGNLLAIAVQATPKTNAGVIAFYSLSATGTPSFLKKVTVGALPDGVAFSPDGKYLVVANEGELSNSFMTDGIDPEGTISIVNISNGVPSDTAVQLGFTDFNTGGKRASELPATVRIGRPGASVAQDLEPEYVAISADSKTAFITLQENNAVAVVDLATAKIDKIFALGFKDYGSKYKIAASDAMRVPVLRLMAAHQLKLI